MIRKVACKNKVKILLSETQLLLLLWRYRKDDCGKLQIRAKYKQVKT